MCKCLTELYSANSEWWEPRRFLKHLPFFLTGVPKAQIVRTRRIGPIPARSCESERGDALVRDSIVGIEKTAHPLVETNDLYLRGLSQKEDSMESAISRLLETYEKGKVSRRDLVQGLVLLAARPGTMSAAGFQGNTINHVSLDVSDLERSTDFYQRTFGCPVHKRQGDNQVFFGTNFFVLRPGKPAGRIGHVAIGVEDFSQDSVTADLKARGVNPIDSGQGGIGEGFHVVDPDGFTLQIVSASNRGRG